jgi:hypothetical protein
MRCQTSTTIRGKKTAPSLMKTGNKQGGRIEKTDKNNVMEKKRLRRVFNIVVEIVCRCCMYPVRKDRI